MGPSWTHPKETTWAQHPVGLPLTGGIIAVRGSQEWRPWRTNPLLSRLVIETRNATSLVGMDPELVHEVERYRVDVVRLTSLNVLEQASLRKA